MVGGKKGRAPWFGGKKGHAPWLGVRKGMLRGWE